MGYTHYFTREGTDDLDPAAFKAFAKEAKRVAETLCPGELAEEYDTPDKPPVFSADEVRFNGKGEDGHETFYLDLQARGFNFCKTARKPYDAAVMGILVLLGQRFPGKFDIARDGDNDFTQKQMEAMVATILGKGKGKGKG